MDCLGIFKYYKLGNNSLKYFSGEVVTQIPLQFRKERKFRKENYLLVVYPLLTEMNWQS